MKQSKLVLLASLCAAAFLFQPSTVSAAMAAPKTSVPAAVSTEAPAAARTLSKKETRKIERFKNRLERVAKKHGLDKIADISIDDPAEKWLVRWLVCWGIGLILSILGAVALYPLWYASYLIWTLGTVCAIIWILKITDSI